MKSMNKTEAPFAPWRDLVALTPWEKVWEITLPVPWLVLSLILYGKGWWWAGLVCSFYLFLTGLRLSHNAQHCALGVRRWFHDSILFLLSIIMLGSMHAVQTTHLHHHRHCLEEEDAEGATARLPWWKALAMGPVFPWRLHANAWRLASAGQRRWIAAELGCMAAIIFATVMSGPMVLRWHFAAMLLGECFTGFFAVWTVHRGCAAGEPGRTERAGWINLISYSMFYHAEHHIYPAVPTIHLGKLAQRLDIVRPGFAEGGLVMPRFLRGFPRFPQQTTKVKG